MSYHTAPVGVREPFAFTPVELAALLKAEHAAGLPALLLSTCNRCELYWTGEREAEAWFRDFGRSRGGDPDVALTRLDGLSAVRHLFTVAAGLDSQILGETEILGQVRRAFDQARAAGTTTREMDAIFSAALAAGRRVRHETLLGRHPASVSSAAVDVAADRLGGVGGRTIVVLGAGEAAEGALRSLQERGPARVTLINRHTQRARTLAAAWGASTGEWTDLAAHLGEADVLLVATGAARPVILARQLAEAGSNRGGRSLIVMDLSVPRNVEPDARSLEGIELFDLDDLQRLRCPAAGPLSASLQEAERVLAEEIEHLEAGLRSRAAAPRLAELHRLGVEVAEQETAWVFDRLQDLTEGEREVVRAMADRLIRRVLYPMSRVIREDGR